MSGKKRVYSEEYVEKCSAHSFYGGSASAYEAAAAYLMKTASAHFENGCDDSAELLRTVSEDLTKLAAEERRKQHEYA